MDLTESDVHSFIVKLWFEAGGGEAAQTDWHGHITHVPDGARRYLQELDDIVEFIEPYVRAAGGVPAKRTRFRRWLRRWK